MKYIKLFEDYLDNSNDYDVILYPGKGVFVRVDDELRKEIIDVINGQKTNIYISKNDKSNRDLNIYKQNNLLIFETKEGSKPTIEIEDVLLSLNS